jgi:hypothetical protein
VLRQPGALRQWTAVRTGVVSALAETECLRTLDRLRVRANLSDPEVARRRQAVFRLLESLEVVAVTATVLARAAQPLPTELGTLDAIHLATALLWWEHSGGDLVMATHDLLLATAARACGLPVIGDS